MKLPRFIGIVDLGIATVVVVALVLPPRAMEAEAALPGGDADRFAVALAEARTIAHPDDAAAAAELSRRLGEAGFNDWAIETAVKGSERGKASPARWRALLAASVAFIDRHDANEALELVDSAISACETAGDACPAFELAKMQMYARSVGQGVKSGINPHEDPAGFRKASKLISVHAGPLPTQESTAPRDAGP
jgi:hypothetical protein